MTETATGACVFGCARRRLQTRGALTVTYAVTGSAAGVAAAASAPTAAFSAALAANVAADYGGVSVAAASAPAPATAAPAGLAAGAQAGIAIGVLVALAVLAAGGYAALRSRDKARQKGIARAPVDAVAAVPPTHEFDNSVVRRASQSA